LNETLTCSNPDCEIAANGSCLQGHDPVQSCPHFGKPTVASAPSEEAAPEVAVEAEANPEIPKTKLPQGDPLSQLEVDAQQMQRAGRLVAVIGDTSSGKSTLLCALYDRFLRGEFGERSFVGSLTLGGFEKLAHLSRAASGAQTPDTERTFVSEGLQYYHLALANQSQHRMDLFISDRAGETYRSGMDRPNEFRQLPELSIARVVTVLVDGARLARQEELHEVLGATRRMVRALVDSEVLNSSQHLQIVLTKQDEVERTGRSASVKSQLEELVQRFKTDFGTSLATIDFFAVAARDPSGVLVPAYGCDDLLTAWCDAAEPPVRRVLQDRPAATQFDRLALVLPRRART
jgi:GTP-binding protein EngB required for normal cell division